MLVELVPMAFRIEAAKALREDEWSATKTAANGEAGGSKEEAAAEEERKDKKITASLGVGGIGGSAPGMDEDELRDNVYWRLDDAGYRVGVALAERYGVDYFGEDIQSCS